MSQYEPSRGWRRSAQCSRDWPVSGSRTESARGDHWLPFRTSEAAQPLMNSEGKVLLAAVRGDSLRQARVQWATGAGSSTLIGASGEVCTLGDRHSGGDGSSGCSSANLGSFCLNRVSRTERVAGGRRAASGCRGVSTIGAGGGGGVVVGVATLGGGRRGGGAGSAAEC